MPTPIYVTTELEAVNVMLGAIGADPVNSLTVSLNSDVNIARTTLKETIRVVLEQGWDFNTDTGYSIARSEDDEYLVPSNVAAIDVSEDHPDVRATYRAGKMWDQENHTFTWDKDLTFNVTWFFPFEELPQVARHYITYVAARKFQGRVLGSDTAGQYTAKDEEDARAAFIDAEAVDAKHNILSGNYAVARVLNRSPMVPGVIYSWR